MVKDADNSPRGEIEDWTIVQSPFHDLMACSPDGLWVRGGLGYEFKTKDCVRVPQTPEQILDCEYLQCQTCLSFCRDFVWAWVLCYNRLDTGEFKAYVVVQDEDIWKDLLEPEFVRFVDKTMSMAQLLYKECQNGDADTPVDFEKFFDMHKYNSFFNGVKNERRRLSTASKLGHVFPIKFK